MKHIVLVLGICVVFGACTQAPRDLTPLINQLRDAANAHDVEAALRFYADDATLKDAMGQVHQGKEAIRTWMQGVLQGFRVEPWGYHQSGDTLRWTARMWSDALAPSGVNPVTVNPTAIFAGDKIKHFGIMLTPESRGKMTFAQFYTDVVTKRNVDAIDNYTTEQFTEHQTLPPGVPSGREGVKVYFKMMLDAFSDLKVTPIMFLSDGDKILAHTRWEGTNTGSFMGKPATKKKVSFESMDIITFADGKATEHWGVSDDAALMRQLTGK
jgi:predicted ester cyclase